MECPRCGGQLETYSLGARETRSCSQCNYLGVPVEHQSDRADPEPWSDAIARFYESHAVDPDEVSVDVVPDDLSEIPGIDEDDVDGADDVDRANTDDSGGEHVEEESDDVAGEVDDDHDPDVAGGENEAEREPEDAEDDGDAADDGSVRGEDDEVGDPAIEDGTGSDPGDEGSDPDDEESEAVADGGPDESDRSDASRRHEYLKRK